MLKTFRIISALIVIALALSGMFINPLVTMPYMLIALSIMTFIISAEEKQNKVNSTISFFSGVFILSMVILILVSR
ncbi:hypothetical protein M3Y14_23910 [Bacillus thuringiensis]|uniref:hypothetical protein n=1 Tax=Bacillus thuringiensis TaxID=1428 RepID=UPI002224FEB0|nr:hypothetical protein [Bacillus thuringiensis]UYX51562.1 hypothetical protein M3Y14_23910 [Bacillus thuringiensis]